MEKSDREKLYIKTEDEKLPILPKMIEKYNLQKGTMTPFTNYRIVGPKGEFSRDDKGEENEPIELTKGDLDNEIFLTTSEAIDIAEGADSTTG